MPKLDLSNAKIYKLISSKGDEVYIGSTCKSLSTRISYHKSSYKHKEDQKYCYSFILFEKFIEPL